MKFETKNLVRILLVISATLMHTLPAASVPRQRAIPKKTAVAIEHLIQPYGTAGSPSNCLVCHPEDLENSNHSNQDVLHQEGVLHQQCFLCPSCNEVSHACCVASSLLHHILNLYKNSLTTVALGQNSYDPHTTKPTPNHIIHQMFTCYQQNALYLHQQARAFELPCCKTPVTNTPDFCARVIEYWAGDQYAKDLKEQAKNNSPYPYNFEKNYLIENPDENQFARPRQNCCAIQ